MENKSWIMSLITNFFTSGRNFAPDDPERTSVEYINGVGLFGFVILSGLVIANIIDQDYFAVAIESSLLLFVIVGFISVRVSGKTFIASNIAVFVAITMAVNNFIRGGFEGTGLLWMYTLAPIIFYLKGSKSGSVWSIVTIAFLSFLQILNLQGMVHLPYTDFTINILLFSLSGTLFMSFLYQLSKEKVESASVKTVAKLRFLNKIILETESDASIPDLSKQIVENTMDFMKADAGALIVKFEEKCEIIYSKDILVNDDLAKLIEHTYFFKNLYDEGNSVYSFNDDITQMFPGFFEIASIPIRSSDRIIGSLHLAYKKQKHFSKINKEILESVGSEIGGVLIRKKYEQETHRTLLELEKKNDELSKMNQVMIEREHKIMELREEISKLKKNDSPAETEQQENKPVEPDSNGSLI